MVLTGHSGRCVSQRAKGFVVDGRGGCADWSPLDNNRLALPERWAIISFNEGEGRCCAAKGLGTAAVALPSMNGLPTKLGRK